MASSSSSAFFVLAIAVVYAATGALAATFEVGDNKIWSIPSTPSYYTDWAIRQTFAVGDTLVFNFNNGAHDVVEVTKANYDSCTSSNPIATYNAGPASVQLTSAGAKYFICGVNGHCSAGQKMAVTVAAASSPSAAPPTSTGRPTTPGTGATPRPGRPSRRPSASGAAPSAGLGMRATAATLGLTIMAAALIL